MQEFDKPGAPAIDLRRRPQSLAPTPVVSRSGDGTRAPLDTESILQLQRTAGNASVTELIGEEREASPVKGFLSASSGQALDGETRASMEGALGADLSDVRVHRGGDAAASAASVQARAYTVGSDVVLGNDVSTSSREGQKTLAHELTHVVQQRSGPVDGSPAPGGIRLSDPGDRFERAAESTAETIVGGRSADVGPAAASAGAPTAQRAPAAPGTDDELEDDSADPTTQRATTTPADDEKDEDIPA